MISIMITTPNTFKMTNNNPWQTVLNAKNANQVILSENNLAAVKKSTIMVKNSPNLTADAEVRMPRRYSFDDNGGGYLGL